MTVADLIAALQKMPQDALVAVIDSELGYVHPTSVQDVSGHPDAAKIVAIG